MEELISLNMSRGVFMSVPIDELKNRLKLAMAKMNLRPIELSEKTNIPKSSISQYMSGYAKPNSERVYLISKALNVSEAWLMGFDVSPNRNFDNAESSNDIDYEKLGIRPIKTKKFPMLGKIACGEPIYADADYETFIEASADIRADFCLTAKGDSMINARIFDGDIVFIKRQPSVENGEIAAVIINDDVTLKRVYMYINRLELRPENPTHEVLNYEGEELNQIHILGKAVAFQSYVR